jgi:HK97 family phage major capsid protein
MENTEQVKKLIEETEALHTKVKSLETEKEALIASGKSYHSTEVRSYSDEQRALRYFGKSHPAELLKTNVSAPEFRMVPDELKHLVLTLKRNVDIARWTAQMFHGAPLDRIGQQDEKMDSVSHVKNMLETHFGKEVLAPMIKAFGTAVTGGGAEWVPTAISQAWIEEYELEKILEQRLQQVQMPTKVFELPVMTGVTKARKAGEGSGMTASNWGTTKITLTSIKTAEYNEIPEELDEDSAPSFMAAARSEIVMAQKRAAEAALVNGCTGTHMDSDTAALGADVAEKLFNGFRKLALLNSANGGTYDFTNSDLDEPKLAAMRAQMKKFGVSPRQLLWIPGPTVYQQFLGLPNVATIDKFGPQATVLQGALAAYAGIPIYNCEYMREDLNASGVYDATTMTQCGLLLVNATRFYLGTRRPIQVKLMQDLPAYDRWLLASYRRWAFSGHAQGAAEASIVYGLNIAK